MTVLVNSFEGGTAGSAVTTGGSGGISGNAFDVTSGSPVYEAAAAIFGSLGMSAPLAASSSCAAGWSTSFGSGFSTQFWGQDFFTIPSNPPNVTRISEGVGAGTARWGIAVDTTGKVGVRNLNTGAFTAEGATVVTPGAKNRYEFDATYSGTQWTVVLRLFYGANFNGSTPSETVTSTAMTLGTVDTYRFGADASTSETWSPAHDQVGLSTTGFFGPASVPTITTTSLAAGTASTSYGQTVTASGGTTPYAWGISAGSLPPGLAISASGGAITGTPTAGGVYGFTVEVSDANGNNATQPLAITITGASVPSISRPPAGFGIFGAYPGAGNALPTTYETNVLGGTRLLGCFYRYYAITQTVPQASDLTEAAQGRILVMSLASSFAVPPASGGITYAQVTAGTYDSQLNSIGNLIATAASPVFVVWGHEMELSGNAGFGAPADFIASFQHVATVLRAAAPGNVIMCWVASFGTSTKQAGQSAATAAYYPGDAYVDWLGVDPYDPTLAKGSPMATYQPFITWLNTNPLSASGGAGSGGGLGKPVGIFETGVSTTSETDANVAAWIQGGGGFGSGVPAALKALGYQLWMWFNSAGIYGTVLNAGSQSAAAMSAIGADPFFNPPASVSPSQPYSLGSGNANTAGSGGTSTVAWTVIATTVLGQAIVVAASINNATGVLPTGVADSQGNTYAVQSPDSTSIYGIRLFVAEDCAVLTQGTDTITVTFGSASAIGRGAAAVAIPNAPASGAIDLVVTPATSAGSANPAITTLTLAQSSETVVAVIASGSAGGSMNWGNGFTPTVPGFEVTGSNQWMSIGTLDTASTTPVTASGTITSAKWVMLAITIKVTSVPVVTTSSLPGAFTGAPYSQALTASGGVLPYAWSVSSGSLPAGLSLSSAGVISGTPGTAGSGTSFTVEVTDANSNSATAGLSITVTSNVAITTPSLPGGVTGAAYSQSVTATGGVLPYAWSVSSGSLPAGLSLDPVAGLISGTLEAAGTTSFTVEVTDAASNTDTQPLSIAVTSNLNITTTSLPAASTGAAYSQTLAATGGFGAYTWSLASGSLPSPLTLSSAGLISGTPAGAGTSLFTVEVTDAAGNTDTQALSISVSATVNVCGQAAQAVPLSSVQPPAAWKSLQVPVTNTQGDWMIAVVTWRQQEAGEGVTVHVGDDTCRNFWQPLGQPSGTSSASGVTRTAIWTAPAAYAAQYVMVAPTGAVQAMACTVLDVSGLSPWQQVASLATTFANNSGSLSALTTGAVSAGALVITASAPDNNADGITLAGSGWTQLPFVHCSNGTDHTADLTCLTAYQVTTSPTSATWSSSAALDSSGIIASILLTGTAPVQASLNWPYTVAELAIGSGPSTPADELTWTAVSARALNLQNVVQGAQYNLAALTAGQGVLTLDNPDGALIAPGTGSFAGIDSGTPVRVRQAWTGGAWQIQFNGNGSTAFPQGQTSTVLPVQPGQQYTWTCWGASSQPWASGMFAFLAWQGSGGQTAGTITPSGTAAQLLTVTGTAPAGATGVVVGVNVNGTPPSSVTFSAAAAPYDGVAGTLILPPAAAWAGHDGATLTTLAAWTPDPRGAPNACPLSVPFAGYVRTWDQAWDPGLYRGRAQATLADAWAYCTGNPQPILIQEILNDQPYAYWPMTDAEGSTQAANFAPGNTLPLTLTGSKYGVGPAQPAFGANSSALLGAQGTYLLTSSVRAQTQAGMWAVTDVPAGETIQGYSLAVADGNMPFLSQTVTYEIWVQPTAPFLISNDSEVLFLSNASFTNQLSMNFQVSGELQLEDEQSNTYVISNNNFLVDPARLLHVTLVLTRTTYKTYINGSLETSGTFVNSLPLLFPVVTVDGNAGAGGSTSAGAFPGSFNGNFGHLVITPGALTPERIMTHYQAGIAAMTGDSVNDRIERLLQSGNYPGRRVILQDTGTDVTPCASCQDIAGQPVSASIQNIASSTPPAVLAISPPGEVVYLSRDYVWNQPVKWVLGENTANGEIPCLIDFALGYDPARVVNDVQLTQLDNQDIVTPEGQVEAIDIASQAQYGDQPYWVTGYLENDLLSPLAAGPGLLDAANWIGAVNAKPGNRIAQVTVDAASHPGAWTFVSTVAKGDVITVNKRPPTAAGLVITVTGRVSQTTRNLRFSLDGATGSVQLLVDIAPELNVLTADDPIRGQLNGQNILAW